MSPEIIETVDAAHRRRSLPGQLAAGPLTDRHHVRDSRRLQRWGALVAADGGGRFWFTDAKSASTSAAAASAPRNAATSGHRPVAGSWSGGPQRRQPIGPGSAVAVGPLFRATSRDTADTDRPSPPAIAVSVFFWARPREIISRCSNDNHDRDCGRRSRGRTPPDWLTNSARSSSTLQPRRSTASTSPRSPVQ